MKAEIHIGLTFHMGSMASNNYGRLDITLSDIDPTVPVEPQIASGIRAAQEAFNAATQEIDKQVRVLTGKSRPA